MKRLDLHILFISLLLIAVHPLVKGQDALMGKSAEKVVLFTDRSIYIVGEQVHFFASLFSGTVSDSVGQSQVLYCEIITPDGSKIVNGKYLIDELSASGCMNIPADLLTGTYYLKAYTKLMRNYGPGSYGYLQLRILNPGRSEVLASDKNQDKPGLLQIQPVPVDLNAMFAVSSDRTVYSPRDTISLSLTALNRASTPLKSLCLSVVPEGCGSQSLFIQPLQEPLRVDRDYYVENQGVSLNGKLVVSSSSIPVKGRKVNLSIIGEGRDFMAARTDSSGRFFFALPDYYGSRDLFLCAERSAGKDVKIWVDNDYCTAPFRLPSPAFSLSDQERLVAYNMALNVQIDSHFQSPAKVEDQVVIKSEKAFYGKPTTVIYLDQYIQLPTFEEYLNELPSLVRVKKHLGEKYFKVLGPRDLAYYDPLVLVDWVAVDEPSKILAMSPVNVSRIEIVAELYVKGSQTYGGIISIISKKGDFAGIDLPSAGIFINYSFLADKRCMDTYGSPVPNLPDTHNTLLWKPGINLRDGENEKYIITAPDTPGKYSVVLEGITPKGERLSTTSFFEVKN